MIPKDYSITYMIQKQIKYILLFFEIDVSITGFYSFLTLFQDIFQSKLNKKIVPLFMNQFSPKQLPFYCTDQYLVPIGWGFRSREDSVAGNTQSPQLHAQPVYCQTGNNVLGIFVLFVSVTPFYLADVHTSRRLCRVEGGEEILSFNVLFGGARLQKSINYILTWFQIFVYFCNRIF